MDEKYLPKDLGGFVIEKKFISRKNNVFLVRGSSPDTEDELMVQKKYSLSYRMAAEAKMLSILKMKGVAVPGILARGENYLLLEYLQGELFLDHYCRLEDIDGPANNALGEPAIRAVCSLCSWFKDFYRAMREISGRQLIMGDVNFRNFILGGQGKIFGIDLEECREGKIEEDFGSLCAYALTYSPTFTSWKWSMASRLFKVFCCEFNLDKELVKKGIRDELFIMAGRRGTLDEIAGIPLTFLLEKNIACS